MKVHFRRKGKLSDKLKWLNKYWFLGFVVTSIIILQILPGHRAFDDAYITYRYARNIAIGNGFTYNVGENVLGTTTPLYTLLLAALGSAISIKEIPNISLLLNSVADIVSVLLLFHIITGLKFSKYLASIVSLAYLYNPLRIGVSRGGMETAFVVALILASLYSFIIRKDDRMAALFAGVAFLARPDTILLPLIYLGYQVIRLKSFPYRELFIYLLITGPWLVFSAFYFDSLLPHSIIAKSNVYLLQPFQATSTILGYIATRSPLEYLGWPTWVVGLSLLINLWLFIIGSIAVIKRNTHALILILFPFFYCLGLMVANPLLFVWYFPPILVLLNSLIIVGVQALFRKPRSKPAATVILLIVGVMVCFEWIALDQPKAGFSSNLRDHEAFYEYVADSLRETIPAGSSIAMPEIGVLGYQFPENRIIDTVGIVTPEAIKYQYRSLQKGQQFSYAIPNRLIMEMQPDYLLSLDIFLLPSLLVSDEFLDQYRLLTSIPTNAMGSNGFSVYTLFEENSDH
jgi:arabinofuranosyltransferase